MANTISAKKRVRQTVRRTEQNKERRSRLRNAFKKVEDAVFSSNKEAAQIAFKNAEPEIMRGVTKGVLPKNTASRKISRLSAGIKTLP